MKRRDTGAWTRAHIARERARAAAKEEIEHGFRGPVTDEDMVRYAQLLDLVNGPAPVRGEDREPDADGWF